MWLFSLVSVIFILWFGDFVFAESAWILWKSENRVKGYSYTGAENWEVKNWNIDQSYQTMKECQKSLKDFIQQQDKKYNDPELSEDTKSRVITNIEGNKGGIIIYFRKQCEGECSNIIRRDLLCLPDTIDPRAPKR